MCFISRTSQQRLKNDGTWHRTPEVLCEAEMGLCLFSLSSPHHISANPRVCLRTARGTRKACFSVGFCLQACPCWARRNLKPDERKVGFPGGATNTCCGRWAPGASPKRRRCGRAGSGDSGAVGTQSSGTGHSADRPGPQCLLWGCRLFHCPSAGPGHQSPGDVCRLKPQTSQGFFLVTGVFLFVFFLVFCFDATTVPTSNKYRCAGRHSEILSLFFLNMVSLGGTSFSQ